MRADEAMVLGALSGVRDSELDGPITELEFVSGLELEAGAVSARVSVVGNAELCRGLLATRYEIPNREERTA
jgi:hypothetical protein